MHVHNFGYLLLLKIGGLKTHLFFIILTTSQVNGNFNGEYLQNRTRYRQPGNGIGKKEGFHTLSQNVVNFGPQLLNIGLEFIPTLRKFCILLHCRPSFTVQVTLTWRHTVNVSETALGFFAAQL